MAVKHFCNKCFILHVHGLKLCVCVYLSGDSGVYARPSEACSSQEWRQQDDVIGSGACFWSFAGLSSISSGQTVPCRADTARWFTALCAGDLAESRTTTHTTTTPSAPPCRQLTLPDAQTDMWDRLNHCHAIRTCSLAEYHGDETTSSAGLRLALSSQLPATSLLSPSLT